MRLALALSLTFALTAPVQAGSCQGQNLIAALPPAELAALQAKADGPYDHGNFWQARKDGQLITIVGTYHMSDPRFDAVLADLAPYLAQAKALLVEAGPAEQAALQSAVSHDPSLMYLTKGPKLFARAASPPLWRPRCSLGFWPRCLKCPPVCFLCQRGPTMAWINA